MNEPNSELVKSYNNGYKNRKLIDVISASSARLSPADFVPKVDVELQIDIEMLMDTIAIFGRDEAYKRIGENMDKEVNEKIKGVSNEKNGQKI
jgi:hypothetical protein